MSAAAGHEQEECRMSSMTITEDRQAGVEVQAAAAGEFLATFAIEAEYDAADPLTLAVHRRIVDVVHLFDQVAHEACGVGQAAGVTDPSGELLASVDVLRSTISAWLGTVEFDR
jgi:hypothetical protein